jgi:hypothetical protein
MAQIDWVAARDAVGVEVSAIVEETGRVLWQWARDALGAQHSAIAGKSGVLLGGSARDEKEGKCRSP